MSYLTRLKGRLAETADLAPTPFEGFEGARGTHVSPDLSPAVPNFSSIEEEKLKYQFFSQKKPPLDAGQPPQVPHETRLPSEPSKPSKGSAAAGDTGPDLWRRHFYNLSATAAPCPGFKGREWSRVFDAIHAFLEQYAETAAALGWTAIELFGVHPVVGATRVDCCGALMVSSGSTVVSVERDVITFSRARSLSRARFFRRPYQPDSVLLWDFTPNIKVTA